MNRAAFDVARKIIAERLRSGQTIRETEVQDLVMDYYTEHGMTTYPPPIVGVNSNIGDPHYCPVHGADSEIKVGDFVLLDMWAKMGVPEGIYSDFSKVGFIGETVPDKYKETYDIVAAARNAGIECTQCAFSEGRELQGWEVAER